MGTRRQARELVLQFLYQQDMRSKYPTALTEALSEFWNLQEHDKTLKLFSEEWQGIQKARCKVAPR